MTNSIQIISTSDTEGCLFSVSGVRYLAPCSNEFPEFRQVKPGLSMVTIFPVSPKGKRITLQLIQKLLDEYRKDDVFNDAFLTNVILNDSLKTGEHLLDKDARAFLKASGATKINIIAESDLLPGPHVILDGQLREVWKLVDDSNGTCMIALKPQQIKDGAFEPLSIMCQHNHVLTFAIPSRLRHRTEYSSKVENFSLAGMRILVKDNIHLKGIKTSVGNRAFYDAYPPQKKTARCVQDLRNKGALVLGKTKMTSFGNWEEPTEYIDYQAPWNPRADGYQSPGGSSSGSASAIAAYDWLDITIGTDTWGSVTRPAHWCGCFGLRPSIGALSAKDVVPCIQLWDIPGILARDLEKCKILAENWLNFDKFEDIPQNFSSIIWPTDFWEGESMRRDKARRFAQKMADRLDVLFKEISFRDRWENTRPKGYDRSLTKFMEMTASGLAYDIYHSSDDFRSRYKKLYKQAPYTSAQNEEVWSIGKTTRLEGRDAVFERIEIYRQWFHKSVWTGEHANAIIVLPLDMADPRYRDEFPTFPRPPQPGINALALGPVMKAPVLAIPISQTPYRSRVSRLEERLPFAVALMGTPGTDLKLIETAMFVLGCLNIPTKFRTGRAM